MLLDETKTDMKEALNILCKCRNKMLIMQSQTLYIFGYQTNIQIKKCFKFTF